MIRLPPFELECPRTLAAAAAVLEAKGASQGVAVRLAAGGTDLWPNLKRGSQKASTVVSLGAIEELRGIRSLDDGSLSIGATTTLDRIAAAGEIRRRFPSLASAARGVSTPALRNMGTLGGNLCLDTRCNYYNQSEEWRRSIDYCMKEEGTVCWVAPSSSRCWAVTSGDLGPVLCSLDAQVKLVSETGERRLRVADLYRDDGIEYLRKRPEEILAEVVLPARSSAEHCRASFRKLARRGSIDFAVASVAAGVWTDAAGALERTSLVLGSVASSPLVVETDLLERGVVELSAASIAEVARSCRQAATPLDNTDFAAQWRGRMVEILATEALEACRR